MRSAILLTDAYHELKVGFLFFYESSPDDELKHLVKCLLESAALMFYWIPTWTPPSGCKPSVRYFCCDEVQSKVGRSLGFIVGCMFGLITAEFLSAFVHVELNVSQASCNAGHAAALRQAAFRRSASSA